MRKEYENEILRESLKHAREKRDGQGEGQHWSREQEKTSHAMRKVRPSLNSRTASLDSNL